MLGDTLIPWLDLFSGIAVYTIEEDGPSNNEGWVNIKEYIRIFEQGKLKLNGKPYEGEDAKRKEELEDAIIKNAGILCTLRLLERNRGNHPPRLEYRVTKLGRKIDSLRDGLFGEFRRKFFFFRKALYYEIIKYKWIVTTGAFLMAIVNAIRFYSLAFTWLSEFSVFLVSLLIPIGIAVYASIKRDG